MPESSPQEAPTISIAQMWARVRRRVWWVVAAGVAGAALVLAVATAKPRYEMTLEALPPGWDAIADLNRSGLVQFDPVELHRRVLDAAVAQGTAQRAWEAADPSSAENAPDGARPPVQVVLLQAPSAGVNANGGRATIHARGPSPRLVEDFLREALTIARQSVLDDAQDRLQGAVTLHREVLQREISRLRGGEGDLNGGTTTLAERERQRHQDRLAALQGGAHERIPYAFMDMRQLQSELSLYDGLEFPRELDAVARIDWGSQDGPRNWYTIWHVLAGFVVGLVGGAWVSLLPPDEERRAADEEAA